MGKDRCERCWSRGGLQEHPIEGLLRAPILCRACREAAPKDPLVFREVFLRFGSTKELLSHFNARDEDEAVRKLCIERKLDYGTVLRGILSHGSGSSAIGFEEFTRPYGYETRTGDLKVNPGEARTVGLIFEMYLEGRGIAKICEALNHAEIRTKTGKRWQSQTIANILRNPLYCGYIRQDGALLNGTHRRIVDQDKFSQVQVEMEKRIRRPDQKREAGLFKPLSRGT